MDAHLAQVAIMDPHLAQVGYNGSTVRTQYSDHKLLLAVSPPYIPLVIDLRERRLCAKCKSQLNHFFKENVRYPIWIFRDPISLILKT